LLIWQLWPGAWSSVLPKKPRDPMVIFEVGKLRQSGAFSKPVAKLDDAESVQPPSAVFTSSTKQPAALAGLKARVLRGQPHLPNPKPSPALSTMLHPEYKRLIKEYPFQPVRNQNGDFVNVILVRSPFRSSHQWDLFKQYKDSLLFIGISSFEDFPLPPPNPFSSKFPVDTYVGLFPGFLHMEREPEKVFPPDVKLLLMSQSDFALPPKGPNMPKKYDFTFSGSDQDVYRDCVGWSSFAKNWTFAKEALEAMCSQGVTGVLVATKDKKGRKACTIPPNCEGKIVQTTFLAQEEFFNYVRQSKFLFVPQVHDASPRVTTQALALDVPLLMNRNIIGGWKYVNEKTGEFFHDMSDFRDSLARILSKADRHEYEPRKWVLENAGDQNSGIKLKNFIAENFADRVKLPEGTRMLFPSGA